MATARVSSSPTGGRRSLECAASIVTRIPEMRGLGDYIISMSSPKPAARESEDNLWTCLGLARARFDRVRVRTFEAEAARLYEALGFERVEESDTTHCHFLRRMSTG